MPELDVDWLYWAPSKALAVSATGAAVLAQVNYEFEWDHPALALSIGRKPETWLFFEQNAPPGVSPSPCKTSMIRIHC
jgi:hypothetical protein